MIHTNLKNRTAARLGASGKPRIMLSASRAIYVGPGMKLSPHKVAVATIVIALSEPFELEILDPAQPSVIRGNLALIPPDTLHHLKTNGHMVFIYLDPLSDDFLTLDLTVFQSLENEAAERVTEAITKSAEEKSVELKVAKICSIFDLPVLGPRDNRIAAVMRAIDEAPQDFSNIEKAAKLAGLSVPRFQHIFKEVAGTPFRRYRLWKRMAIVAHSLNSGASLTNAAYYAGFSSSAHLSAAFREMFGIKPSDLLSRQIKFELDI